jgi:two-component system sporulation sensor kinase A
MSNRPQGSLSIQAFLLKEEKQNWIHVKILDTGDGISPEHLSKIFELGFTTKSNGMGYGLWRSRAVIEKIGGKISVESVINHGTTFDIRLPAMEEGFCND